MKRFSKENTFAPASSSPPVFLLFKGNELQLKVTYTHCKPAIRITDQQLWMNFYQGSPVVPVSTALLHWYRLQALQYLRERTAFWAQILHVKFQRITIKDQRTRWGSCSSLHNLNYNWRIIMAPEPVIDYLVIHEVSHLVYLNHSAHFWNLVAQHDPHYKEHKLWLYQNGRRLFQLFSSQIR